MQRVGAHTIELIEAYGDTSPLLNLPFQQPNHTHHVDGRQHYHSEPQQSPPGILDEPDYASTGRNGIGCLRWVHGATESNIVLSCILPQITARRSHGISLW